ncbi:signal transduction histidine kinase [Kibdelosporangium banguiense]|uniref:Oxygen sensor histidine kinase NreB n=1 Tax=Kibdelosporangium banguiense TaxID=1365924 RepID=A0ABS4TSF7_9PSEU|nr:ATP-binding protein [Kibdelosporangium banguiense]MBP2327328.1 signal transduction histidine kinase [Kibdelosporangium banguiense]
MLLRTMVAGRAWWSGREVLLSRVIGGLAAACVAVAVARLTLPGEWIGSHPRNWVVAIAFTLLGMRVIGHVPGNRVGWLLLVTGLSGAITVAAEAWPGITPMSWIGTWSCWLTYGLLPLLALLFPTGKLLSRRWSPVLVGGSVATALAVIGIGWASWSSPDSFWTGVDDPGAGTQRGLPLVIAVVGLAGTAVTALLAIAALVIRSRRVSGDQRRVVLLALVSTVILLLAAITEMLGVMWGAWAVSAVAIPVVASVAIMRYGLYDIDLIVHRTLLYCLLIAGLVLTYTVVVTLAMRPFPHQAEEIATVAVVIMLAPLYRTLLRRLDRRLFGHRADPYIALSSLSERLENPISEPLVAVANTVAVALRLPYVAVYVGTDDRRSLVAESGRNRGWQQVSVPMTYDCKQVGELIVEVRSPEERLGGREQRLLHDLARQVAPSAWSEQLSQDLRRARQKFIQDLEENARRTMQDLHDEIGPSLAGALLQVDAARRMVQDKDGQAHDLLASVIEHIRATQLDIRQLIERIWPTQLRHGLSEALRALAEKFTSPDFAVEVCTKDVQEVPAAVETAVYRIAREAVANTITHSGASHCHIRLYGKENLSLEVIDDGSGIEPSAGGGLGLVSMRQRCEELGGTFSITNHPPRGTAVVANLPIGRPTYS